MRKNMLEKMKRVQLGEQEYRNLAEEYEDLIEVEMGATAIKHCLTKSI